MRRTIITITILILGLTYSVQGKGETKVVAPELNGTDLIWRGFNFQGNLYQNGNAVTDTMDMSFGIYDASIGGTLLFQQTKTNVVVSNGWFSVNLDSVAGSVFPTSGPTRYLEVKAPASGSPLTPRILLTSVGYSYRSFSADTAEYAKAAPLTGSAGGDLTGTFPNPTIVPNAVTTNKIQNGTILPEDLSFTPGDITAVNAGTGLTGGGTTGELTLNFNSSWSDTNYLNSSGPDSITGNGADSIPILLVKNRNGSVAFRAESYSDTGFVTDKNDQEVVIGCEGKADAEGNSDAIGGHFYTSEAGYGDHYGVKTEGFGGWADGKTYGIYSTVTNNINLAGKVVGGYFEASGTADVCGINASALGAFGKGKGVEGKGGQYGGYFSTGSLYTPNQNHYGIYAEGNDNSEKATYGMHSVANNSSSGLAYGGYFSTAKNGTGQHYGLKAESHSGENIETYGIHSSANNTSEGEVYGGYFTTTDSGSGEHFGLYAEGISSSLNNNRATGIVGYASNGSSGDAYGGHFITPFIGTGIHCGILTEGLGASSATSYGIKSHAANLVSGDVYGGYFQTYKGGTGQHYGLKAESHSGENIETYGIHSSANNTSQGNVYGGYFSTTDSGIGEHYGIYAKGNSSSHDRAVYGSWNEACNTDGDAYGGYFWTRDAGIGNHYGIYAHCEGSSEGDAYGGYFISDGTGTGTKYGIRAKATGVGNYAGYFEGDVNVTGTVKMVDGNQGLGKVLTSDANGVGTWQLSAGGPPSGPAGGDLTGSTYPNPIIANDKITSAKILDGTITSADIGTGAVTTNKIENNSITTEKIHDTGITNDDLGEQIIDSYNIMDGAIIETNIANNAINSDHIQDNAVNSDHIQDLTIRGVDIQKACTLDASIGNNLAVLLTKNTDANGYALQTEGASIFKGTCYWPNNDKSAPIVVTSTSVCPNLNSDLFDGKHSASSGTAIVPYTDSSGKLNTAVIPPIPPGGSAGGDLSGTYPNPTIANNAVNSAKILDRSVNGDDISRPLVLSDSVQEPILTISNNYVTKNAVDQTFASGISVSSSNGNAVYVPFAGIDGVDVVNAMNDGIQVDTANQHGVNVIFCNQNGANIGNTRKHGVYVRNADTCGVKVYKARFGLMVDTATYNGIRIKSSTDDAIRIDSAGYWGLWVNKSRYDGVHVSNTSASATAAVYGYSAPKSGGYFQNNNDTYYALAAYSNSDTSKAIYARGYGLSTDGWLTSFSDKRTGFSLVSTDMEMTFSGSSSLRDGIARIEFEKDLKDIISSDVPLKIIVTPASECNGIYVSYRSTSGFTVKELMNGKSNATFDWMVIGRIRGHEKRPVIKPVSMETTDDAVRLK